MASLTIPIEIELTPRSRSIMDALYKAIDAKFQDPEQAPQTAASPALDLQPGERYAGMVLDQDGRLVHHLVLKAERPESNLNWKNALEWADEVGGYLPNRQEQALLYANCKSHLKPEWHWSSETYEGDTSYAWYCYFNYGSQSFSLKSYEGSVVAVRRIL
jgi:hypothetical protein